MLETITCGTCKTTTHYHPDSKSVYCPKCRTMLIATSAERHEDHSGETGHTPRGRAKLFKS